MNYSGAPFTASVVVAATPAVIKFDLGFIPSVVMITNRTNGASAIYTNKMADASLHVLSNGAGTAAFLTSAGVTPVVGDVEESAGFNLGTAANINDTATEVLDVIAFPALSVA
jgi:hypothetical protein